MTQDEIIRMAREADVWTEETIFMADVLNEKVERFAALVAANAKSEQINLAYQQGYEEGSAHEREACAKVCEESSYSDEGDYFLERRAAAIRARGEK